MPLYSINNEEVDVETWMAEIKKAIDNVLPLFEDIIGEQSKTRINMGPTGFNAQATRDQYFKKVCTFHGTPKRAFMDLGIFISLFLDYGNNAKKALWKLKHHRVIKSTFDKYGIEINASKHRKLRPDELSLSRIALAFPVVTARVIFKNKSAGVLPYSSFFKQELPLIMQHSIFPGLIPTEKFAKELKEITYILNMEISVIFAMKARRDMLNMDWITETVEKLVESSAKYVDAAIDNGIEDENKLKALTQVGILEANADGELELSAGTVALLNKLPGLKAVYSLPYKEAIEKLKSESDK